MDSHMGDKGLSTELQGSLSSVLVKQLAFRYEGSTGLALYPQSFELGSGELVLISGDSGSGKSTLLHALNGLIPHMVEGKLEGHVLVDGMDIAHTTISALSERVGTVFQNPRSQFFTTNSTAELVFAMENFGLSREAMQERLATIVEDFGIAELLGRDIYELSSGERQVLALACATTLKQHILIFDEPSANLDYVNTKRLARILATMKEKGYTIIVADHRYYYLKDLIDSVLFLEKGHLTRYNSFDSFLASSYRRRSLELFAPLALQSAESFAEQRGGTSPQCQDTPQPLAAAVSLVSLSSLSYKHILRDINLELRAGEISVLIGSNGAGKTTLARVLCGGLKPSRGKVSYRELPFYIMQDADYQLFAPRVVDELKTLPRKVEDKEIFEILQELSLATHAHAHPFSLSGGQKQRLQIALAVLSGRELLIFDEPTSGLDKSSLDAVAERFIKLKATPRPSGIPCGILVITHDYELLQAIADRVIYLDKGRIEADFAYDTSEACCERLRTIIDTME